MKDVAHINVTSIRLLAFLLAIIFCTLVISAQLKLLSVSDDITLINASASSSLMSEGSQNPFATEKLDSNVAMVTRLVSIGVCMGKVSEDAKLHCVPSLFQAINQIYLESLVNTLVIAALIAFTMPLVAFALASIENALRSRGKNQAARCLELGLDIVPYIIWTIILAGIARGIYGQENFLGLGHLLGQQVSKNVSYVVTLLIQYMGFAAFLIAFQSRSCARWLLELQENRIIDSMRASGLTNWSIYFRLFYFGYRPLHYLRQVLFTFIFILLFDFSLSLASPIHQSGGPQMLFNVAAQYETSRNDSERDLESAGEKNLLLTINKIKRINSKEFSKIKQPGLGRRHFLNEKIVQYFEYQNIGLILLVFSILFIRFDFREFLDER